MVVRSSHDDHHAWIEMPDTAIAKFCRIHQVRELSLRLAARGEMGPDNDFDLLVDFLPGARPGLVGGAAMARDLSALLGRRVDFVPRSYFVHRLATLVLCGALSLLKRLF